MMKEKVVAGSNVAFATPKNAEVKKIEVNNEPDNTIKEEEAE
jgi:hypothetical protein